MTNIAQNGAQIFLEWNLALDVLGFKWRSKRDLVIAPSLNITIELSSKKTTENILSGGAPN
jgi:hypothetical protein